MEPWGIVADDLTGACDCAAQLSRLGARTLVALSPGAPPPVSGEWDALAVSTASRAGDAGEAAARVRGAVAWLERCGVPLRYKKIDSTLRGHLAAELSAALRPGQMAVVAPAFPLAGRTQDDGLLAVGGVPVHETELSRDGSSPVASSSVADAFGASSGEAGHLPVAIVQAGAAAVGERLRGERSRGRRLVFVDATLQQHLRALAEALLLPEHRDVLAVGSAGLARELAPLLRPAGAPAAQPPAPQAGPVLLVAGSRQHSTAAQLALLKEQMPGAATIEIDPSALEFRQEAEVAADLAARLIAAGRAGAPAVALTVSARGQAPAPGRAFRERARQLDRVLGRAAASAREALGARGLVLTGGDVAAAVLEAMNVQTLQLGGEVTAGLPLSWVAQGPFRGLRVVTKAGGFGAADALVSAARAVLQDLPAEE